jgi:Na+-driven multidrug efflux pump
MFIEKMGERPLAVSNIIRSLYLLLMIPGWALCSVTNTLVSNALGEGSPDYVIPIIKKMVKFCAVSMFVVLSLAALVPRYAISIYTNNASLVEATVPSYYIIIVALFLFALVSILFNGVLGTANTNISFAIEAITLTAYLTFAWYVAVHLHLRIELVWTSEFVYSLILGNLSYWYLKKGQWRGKVI